MIIYGNELAASFKEKMKAEIETLKKENKFFFRIGKYDL